MIEKGISLALVVITGCLLGGNASADKLGRAFDKTESMTRDAADGSKDAWLTAKTKIELYADSRVSGSQITVETHQGVIALRGKVDSEAARQAAEQIAKGSEGKREVRNDLQVVTSARRKMVDAKDDYIVSTIKARLAEKKSLAGSDIEVRSDAGVVTLSGQAPSLLSSAAASEVAFWVEGVRYVKNGIVASSDH
jgi:hyperosmotically inducible protein